ncbi:hypothetical protein V8C34DRAFT_306023 [Trichoderma compactum]
MQSFQTSAALPPHEIIKDIQKIMERCWTSLDTLHIDDGEWADKAEAEKQSAKFVKWVLEVNPLKNEHQSLGAQLKKAPEYGKPNYVLLVALEDNIKLIEEIIQDEIKYLLISTLWDSFENTLNALRHLSIALRVSISYM